MLKRLIPLIFLIVILSSQALAETTDERLASLDIISQLDSRFRDERYDYFSTKFFEQGCLPASVYNALTALLGTPDTSADDLLPELIPGLCDSRAPQASFAQIERVPELLASATPGSALAQLTAPVKAVSYSTALYNADRTMAEIASLGGEQVVLVAKMNVGENWESLIQVILRLNEEGYGHARLAFPSVGAGYSDMYDVPFGSGTNGHYIALYLEVDDFCRSGTFYLLDSVPRALRSEPRGEGEAFTTAYPFALRQGTAFNYNFDVQRLTPSILKFTPKESQQEALQALIDNAALTDTERTVQLVKLHKRHMDSAVIFGVNQAILYIP